MHVHAGLRVDIRELECMRHNNGNMLALWSRKLMCRWIYATGTVYLQCRLRVHSGNDNVMCGYDVHMLDDRLRRGVRVRGRVGSASRVHL